jgi:hypothetical protein
VGPDELIIRLPKKAILVLIFKPSYSNASGHAAQQLSFRRSKTGKIGRHLLPSIRRRKGSLPLFWFLKVNTIAQPGQASRLRSPFMQTPGDRASAARYPRTQTLSALEGAKKTWRRQWQRSWWGERTRLRAKALWIIRHHVVHASPRTLKRPELCFESRMRRPVSAKDSSLQVVIIYRLTTDRRTVRHPRTSQEAVTFLNLKTVA